ncbi:MAG: Stk1 family PASTA domain-containing Ser/Thr kinase [Peptococcaceae bacterium]|nr:MAG: Stk1 family PASTA domain-containing Ser/Thr kinase [Peptococcaceae bacterium]
MIGTLLGKRYKILEQLGGGGMAVVYKGQDTLLNRLVTVKVLRSEFTSDEDFVNRFRREAQAVARLSHPNIVSIYDVGEENETYYLVMEFVDGDNLKNLIRKQGTISVLQAIQFAAQICDALEHAHENGIVHRDIKPHNILITRSGRAKLTDFGIARESTAATMTQTDAIVGSVHYLSPEQARGETAGPMSDLYSLGVVLYEMVTGILPFHGDTPISIALKHIQTSPVPPSSLNPAVSPEVDKIIGRAMAKNPDDRYRTAGEMRAGLSVLQNGWTDDATRVIKRDEFATRLMSKGKELPWVKKVKRRSYKWLWAVLIMLILFGGAFAALRLYLNVAEVTVPQVEGKTEVDARNILQSNGLERLLVSYANHPVILKDRVVSQEPAAGSKVKVTRPVTLVVSLGPEYRTVPSVLGLTEADARLLLGRNEFAVSEPVQQDYSSEYVAGMVMAQEPRPKTQAAKGSKVTITVSKGPPPITYTVPDLTGLTVEKAREELAKIKLVLSDEINKVPSRDYLSGQILSQQPKAKDVVQEGTVVKVTVSDGPGPARRLARIEALIPADRNDHELKIVVKDVRGSTVAYINTHSSGDRVFKEVPYYGKAAIQVYIDNKLAGEQTFG